MNGDLVFNAAFLTLCGFVVWMIFTTIRRYKNMKLQAEIQHKLLDKFASSQDLLSYVESEVGKQFLNSLTMEPSTPYGRILSAVQASVLLSFFGAALLFLRGKVSGADEGFLAFGTVFVALGVGFASSACISYFLSKSFGLLKGSHAQQ
ncbi:MAG TPA: hypothetical protein VNE63_15000 [Candidatus Acidoferrales bacterium]|nr:hypothetical protein [Candidatus Acidoferrales bacterium]